MNSFQDIFLIFISPTKYIYTIGLYEVQYLYTVYSYSFFIWKSFKAKIFYRCNLWIFIEFLNSYPQATRVLLPTPEYFVQGRYLHRIVFSALVIGLCRITHLVTCTVCNARLISKILVMHILLVKQNSAVAGPSTVKRGRGPIENIF